VVELAAPPPLEARPEAIDVPIIFEDKRIAVIDKPAGMVVHRLRAITRELW